MGWRTLPLLIIPGKTILSFSPIMEPWAVGGRAEEVGVEVQSNGTWSMRERER